MSPPTSKQTMRLIYAGERDPLNCVHDVQLGQGCFCPQCPSDETSVANPPDCICRYRHPSDPMCTYSEQQYESGYTVAELAAKCVLKDRHIARIEAEAEARAAGETSAERKGPSIHAICVAYESGVGNGMHQADPINPYADGDLHIAYDHGLRKGQAERSQVKAAGES